jgi:hypothetical protein
MPAPLPTRSRLEGKPCYRTVSGRTGNTARVFSSALPSLPLGRRLLEHRGSLIIRQLCVLLNPKAIYMSLATVLGAKGREAATAENLEFVSIMIQVMT